MTDTVQDDVFAAEQRRCAAMLANDPAKLEALLEDRLHFSHATGSVDDKAAYLAKMAAGRIEYITIDWTDQRVTPLDPTAALLTGRMTSLVRVEGVEKRLDNRVTSVWTKSGETWRLIAFQPTPLKG